MALPLFQVSKYRKMPFRAQGVNTMTFRRVRLLLIRPSHNPKKNVLFLTMGPPALTEYSFRLFQSVGMAFHAPVFGSTWRLLFHVLASSALFRMDHTAAP